MIGKIEQIARQRNHRNRAIRQLSESFWNLMGMHSYHIAIVGNRKAIKNLIEYADKEQRNRIRYIIAPRQINQLVPELLPKSHSGLKGIDLIVLPEQHNKNIISEKIRKSLIHDIPVTALFESLLTFPNTIYRGYRKETVRKKIFPKTTYVIASSKRTGSTMLCNMIMKTAILGYPAEYIHYNLCVLAQQKLVKAGPVLTEAIINNQTPNGIFGIKTHWSALEFFYRTVFQELKNNEKAILENLFNHSFYIYLTRKNKIRQAISDWRAVNTGVWQIHLNDNDSVKQKNKERIPYNYEQIKHHLNNLIKDDEEWKKFFEKKNITPLAIVYEKMIQHPEDTLNRIMAHLGMVSNQLSIEPDTCRISDDYTELIYRKFVSDFKREYGGELLDEFRGISSSTKKRMRQANLKPQKRKNAVLVTMATADYLDMAKQFFAGAHLNSGWDGDYLLLFHADYETNLSWFEDRGIIIKPCKSIYDGRPGGMHPSLANKFYMFTPYFKQWDTVVYSDLDVIVRGPLNELKSSEGFCAVEDWSPTLREQIVDDRDIEERGLDPDECNILIKRAKRQYSLSKRPFCAGFFAFSTRIITENMFDKLKQTMDQNRVISKFGDQLSFNFFFYDKWIRLKPTYNILVRQEIDISQYGGRFESMTRWGFVEDVEGYILHVFNPKPWDNKSNYYLEWLSNLKRAENINFLKTAKVNLENFDRIKKTEERIKLREHIYRIIEYFGPAKTKVISVLQFLYWKFFFIKRVKCYVGFRLRIFVRKKFSGNNNLDELGKKQDGALS